MTDKDRLYFRLPRPVSKYHERIGNVTSISKEQLDYFKDKDFDILQKSIEGTSRRLLDAMLGKIEFGKDYAIRVEMKQEEDIPMNQIIVRQEMQIDELVKCKDCTNFVGEYGKGFCTLGMLGRDLIYSSDYCSYGERRNDETD